MKGKLYRSLFRDEFSELVLFLSSFEKRRGGGEKGTKYRTSFSNSISIKRDCFKLINDNFQLYSRNKKNGKIEQKRNFGNFGNFGLVDKRIRMNNISVSRCYENGTKRRNRRNCSSAISSLSPPPLRNYVTRFTTFILSREERCWRDLFLVTIIELSK